MPGVTSSANIRKGFRKFWYVNIACSFFFNLMDSITLSEVQFRNRIQQIED